MLFSEMTILDLIKYLQTNRLKSENIKEFIQAFYLANSKFFNQPTCELEFVDKKLKKGNSSIAAFYDYDLNKMIFTEEFLNAVVEEKISQVRLITTIVHEQQHFLQKVNAREGDLSTLSPADKFVALSYALMDASRKLSYEEYFEASVIEGYKSQVYKDFENEILRDKVWHIGYGALPIEVDARDSEIQYLLMLIDSFPNYQPYKVAYQVVRKNSIELYQSAQPYLAKEIAFTDEMIKAETNNPSLKQKRLSFLKIRGNFVNFISKYNVKLDECEELSEKFFPEATQFDIKNVNDNNDN